MIATRTRLFRSTVVHSGLYMVEADDRTFYVSRKSNGRGYVVRAVDSGTDPFFEPYDTLAAAKQAIRALFVDPCQLHGEQPEAICETCTKIADY
jgi:hypothetical protein